MARKTAKPLALAALLLAAPAWGQVYKCPDASGRTVIQQIPCTGGQAVDVKPASGQATPQAAGAAQARLGKMQHENRMAEAIRTGQPMLGMTVKQLNQAMGGADKVNITKHGDVRTEQVIFYRPKGTWYVYTKNGVVDSIQFQDGPPPGHARGAAQRWCPSSHELRNLEVSASSGLATEGQKLAHQRAVEAAQACK